MAYIGAVCRFSGADKVDEAEVRLIEKLGKSRGRAIRFINSHPIKAEANGLIWRSVVFIMPSRFILRNDVIQEYMKRFHCDWQLAKFHCYREHSLDMLIKTEEWPELIRPTTQPVQVKENTTEEATKG